MFDFINYVERVETTCDHCGRTAFFSDYYPATQRQMREHGWVLTERTGHDYNTFCSAACKEAHFTGGMDAVYDILYGDPGRKPEA